MDPIEYMAEKNSLLRSGEPLFILARNYYIMHWLGGDLQYAFHTVLGVMVSDPFDPKLLICDM